MTENFFYKKMNGNPSTPKRSRSRGRSRSRSRRNRARLVPRSLSSSGGSIVNITSGYKAGPIPQVLVSKLRYSDYGIGMDASAGTVASNFYRATSLYDPDYTGVGHQPMGFDQLMGLYSRFTVLGARIRVTFSNNTATPDNTSVVYVRLVTTPTSSLASEILETSGANWTVLAAGTQPKTLTMNYSMKKMFPGASAVDNEYWGTASANPSNEVYFEIGTFGHNVLVNPDQVLATVEIEFISQFHDPIVLSSS